VLQGFVSQGTSQHAAGGAVIDCGAGSGVLPTGVFTLAGSLNISNIPITGSGTFAPGPATFLLQLKVNGAVVYSTTVAITLQAKPTLGAMTLQSSTVVLGATSTSYQTSFTNPGSNLPNITLQGWINQGSARHSAVGPFNDFGSGSGVLPGGSGTLSAPLGAFNTTTGTGTLAPGAATFELQLTQGTDLLATTTLPVTIVPCPTLTAPSPPSTNVIIEGPSVPYTATLNNTGPSLANVSINCLVRQGTAWRRCGNAMTDFGNGAGVLPAGATALSNSILASNSQGGTGTLVAGQATVEGTMLLFNTYTLDTRTVDVLLDPKPTITVLGATSAPVVIDGSSATTFTATLGNQGDSLTGVTLQGWINQGTARRAAGAAVNVDCGGGPGVLPTGSFTATGPITASNTGTGSGTLVGGAATFELDLVENGVVLATNSVAVTLMIKPTIGTVAPASSTIGLEGQPVPYTVTIQNSGSSLSNMTLTSVITQATAQRQAGSISDFSGNHLVVPSGASVGTGQITASNSGARSGTLAPGAATLAVSLKQGSIELAAASIPITLNIPSPTISSVSPISDLVIDGLGDRCTVTLANPGPSLSNVSVQFFFEQNGARRAGGTIAVGVLSSGIWSSSTSVAASNQNAGSGTLVAG